MANFWTVFSYNWHLESKQQNLLPETWIGPDEFMIFEFRGFIKHRIILYDLVHKKYWFWKALSYEAYLTNFWTIYNIKFAQCTAVYIFKKTELIHDQ